MCALSDTQSFYILPPCLISITFNIFPLAVLDSFTRLCFEVIYLIANIKKRLCTRSVKSGQSVALHAAGCLDVEYRTWLVFLKLDPLILAALVGILTEINFATIFSMLSSGIEII